MWFVSGIRRYLCAISAKLDREIAKRVRSVSNYRKKQNELL